MRRFLGMGDPVIPATFPAELVKLAVERGAVASQLFDAAGIEPCALESPDGRVSYRQLGQLAHAVVHRVPARGLGLSLGQRFVMGRWGALGLATMSASDVGSALRLIVRYGHLMAPQAALELREEPGHLALALEQHVKKGPLQVLASEVIAAALFTHLQSIAEGPVQLAGLQFDFERSEGDEEGYSAFFGCPIQFGRPEMVLRLSRAACAVTGRYASAPSAALAEAQCAAALERLQERKSVVTQVRDLLRNGDEGFPDARSAARSLQTSERSLRRALSESGTSYQFLMDETRRELAMGYLRTTSVPVEDIARMAGFSDGRSFRRAFKRWTGMTPGQARKEDRAQSVA